MKAKLCCFPLNLGVNILTSEITSQLAKFRRSSCFVNLPFMSGDRQLSVLHETDVLSEPDVLLFSPLDPSVLVTGTYHLEKDGSRTGSLLVYSVDPSTFMWYVSVYSG
jgi:hypothetical protein